MAGAMADARVSIKVPGMAPVETTLGAMEAAVARVRFDPAATERLAAQAGEKTDAPDMLKPGHNVGGIAAEHLRQFIARIEKLEEEKKVIADDIKEVYAEAKGNGFDTKIIRQIIRLRKQEEADRQEAEALLDLYKQALGMI